MERREQIQLQKRIAVVGSRRRKDEATVREYIRSLPMDAEVISGGCQGVDTWAVDEAKKRGMKTTIFKPYLEAIKNRSDMIQRYYSRNKRIAFYADLVVAFVAPDRKGGTESTIHYALDFGKPVILK